MHLTRSLRAQLERATAHGAGSLTELAAQHRDDPDYVDAVIALAPDVDPSVSEGATWLLKNTLDAGATLTAAQTSQLAAGLPNVTNWSAVLHVCQSIRYLAPERAETDVIATWLAPHLRHDRPFVRAWALDALVCLARQWPHLTENANAALARAGNDGSASVRARVRALSRLG